MNGIEAPLARLTKKLERLASLNAEDKARLAGLPMRIEEVPRFRELVREGDQPEQCCLLASGYACRYKESASGARQIVSFHLRGDLLDIQHLLLSRADHSLETITTATVAWIPKHDLLRLAWERPSVGKALWRDCLVDASIFREWVLNVGRRDAKARVAHMLCEFVARCEVAGLGSAEGFDFPMTQEQVADATGLTSVHVNRTLKALDREGALLRNRSRFQVLDWQQLCTIADFDPAYLHAAALTPRNEASRHRQHQSRRCAH
jgi:CRP-like cAMP-binding protein